MTRSAAGCVSPLVTCIALAASIVLGPSLALAQIAVGAWTDGDAGDQHAWAITPSTLSSDWGLWHVPPRAGAGAAEDGAVRIVGSLERRPEAIAASGGRVWMAFAGGGSRPGYTLLTAAAQRGAIEGTWYSGAGGRLASSAFLATTGRLVALAAGPRGPIALIEEGNGSLALAWYERGVWHWGAGPIEEGAPQASAVGVLADGEVCLVALDGDRILMWQAELPEATSPSGGLELLEPDALLELQAEAQPRDAAPIDLPWQASIATSIDPLLDGRIAGGPISVGARVVLAIANGDSLDVLEVRDGQARIVYEAEPGGIALLGTARRGVIVRLADEAEGAQGRAATRLVIEEFSLDTGRRFFLGAAVFDGPISPSDLRILLVLLVFVSASLLLFVVRTPLEAKPFAPPPGCMLAPPIPRLLAGLADGFLALVLGGELARLLPQGWLAVRVGSEALDFGPLVVGLAVGLLGCTLLEALTGRTPGKLVFGLLVTRTGLEDGAAYRPRRPSIGASLARNAVKWLLPLVAVAGMISPMLRHRGDAISGLGVVGEIPEPKTDANSDQDRRPDDR